MGLLINGQVGWRTAAVIGAPAAASTLWTSVYGVWNAEHTYDVTTLNSGVYAAWNGENTLNDSLGNYNGTNNGSMTYTTGKTGTNALSFNGSSYISLANDALKFTGNFTISTWAKVTVGSVNAIVTSGAGTGYGYRLYIGSNGRIYFEYTRTNGQGEYIVGNTVLSSNVWYHIGIVNDGTSFKIYLNGLEEPFTGGTYQTIGWGANGTNTAQIGKYVGLALYLTGALDALTVWNRALSNSEMNALYNGGAGCQYSFPSSITGTMESTNDSVGTNHGTRPSTTLTGGVPGPSFTTGKIGKAFTFDGINDYVSLPDNSLNLTSKFSYSFWINSNDTTTGAKIVVGNVQSPRSIYSFFHGYEIGTGSGKYYFYFRSGFNLQIFVETTNVVNNGNWNHIVVTYDPTNLTTGAKIYVNGTLNIQGNTLGTSNPIGYSSPMKPCIGARNHSGSPVNFLPNGTSLDALSAWNKELTQADVTELYNAGTGKQYPN
jgi:hypothetical protein